MAYFFLEVAALFLLSFHLRVGESLLRSYHSRSQTRNSLYFVEHDALLLCSQEPINTPNPEPDKSSPQSHAVFS
jgi:hypothetical protein